MTITKEKRDEIRAVVQLKINGRPRYPIKYIAAVFGVSRQSIWRQTEIARSTKATYSKFNEGRWAEQ